MKFLNEKSNKKYKKLVEQIQSIEHIPYSKISPSYGTSSSRTSCIIKGYKKAYDYDIVGVKELLKKVKGAKDTFSEPEKEELQKIKIVIPENVKFVNGTLEVVFK